MNSTNPRKWGKKNQIVGAVLNLKGNQHSKSDLNELILAGSALLFGW
jgi:hypothetical protein